MDPTADQDMEELGGSDKSYNSSPDAEAGTLVTLEKGSLGDMSFQTSDRTTSWTKLANASLSKGGHLEQPQEDDDSMEDEEEGEIAEEELKSSPGQFAKLQGEEIDEEEGDDFITIDSDAVGANGKDSDGFELEDVAHKSSSVDEGDIQELEFSDDDAENKEENAMGQDSIDRKQGNALTAPLSSENLPGGWKAISHVSGFPCYLHDSGVVSWTRPYICPDIQHVGTHSPPFNTFRPAFSPVDLSYVSVNPGRVCTELSSLCMESFKKSVLGGKRKRTGTILAPEAGSKPSEGENGTGEKPKATAPLATEASGGPLSVTEGNETQSTTGELSNRALKKNRYIAARKKREEKEARRDAVRAGLTDLPKAEGKTAISFLQEYTMTKLKCLPKYMVKQADDPLCPYTCTVYLDGVLYGQAEYANKKMSKQLAAEATLEMLLPGFWSGLKNKGQVLTPAHGEQLPTVSSTEMTISQFIKLSVDDSRVVVACGELGIKTPAQVLQEYQNRNPGIIVNYKCDQMPLSPSADTTTYQFKFHFTASCGNRVGHGTGFAKKQAKQYSAQSLLKELHPEVERYITLVEMYSRDVNSRQQQSGNTGQRKQGQQSFNKPGYRPNSGRDNASDGRNALSRTPDIGSEGSRSTGPSPSPPYQGVTEDMNKRDSAGGSRQAERSRTDSRRQEGQLPPHQQRGNNPNAGTFSNRAQYPRDNGGHPRTNVNHSPFHKESGLDVGTNFDIKGNHSRAGFSFLTRLKDELRKKNALSNEQQSQQGETESGQRVPSRQEDLLSQLEF